LTYPLPDASSCCFQQEIIDSLRTRSHGNYYTTAMSPAVAAQVLASMKIIMGADGTNDGMCCFFFFFFFFFLFVLFYLL
jgi:hypothetical protein